MTRTGFAAVVAASVWMAGVSAVQGADTWSAPGFPVQTGLFNQTPVEVALQLGGHDGRMALLSQQFVFETGTLYRLTINNANTVPHFFGTGAFEGYGAEVKVVDAGWWGPTMRQGGPPGEEYASLEVMIEPGGAAVLDFVPTVEGKYKVGCTDPRHADAGMTATFIVTPHGEPLI